MGEQDEIVREFLVESNENLDRLDQELVQLEQDPQNKECLNSIFRTIHTIKGTCGFLEFSKLEKIAHVGENLLDSLRAGRKILDPITATALLQLVDAIRQILSSIEKEGSEGAVDYTALVNLLTELNPPKAVPSTCDSDTSLIAALTTSIEKGTDPQQVQQKQTTEESHANEGGFPVQAMASPTEAPSSIQQSLEGTVAQPVSKNEISRAMPPESQSSETSSRSGNEDEKKGALADSSLRVDVSLLDQLMNLVGELVLARNQILQFTKSHSDAAFVSTTQRLNLITSELQEGVMKTRMQPIANIWNKFPRVIRDVARMCGKEVRVEMEGKETDLDKTIIEAIKDPLTHIVRNAVDHGIESPEKREQAGKPREGVLLLKAFHEGGQVIIEIVDDGAGLNPERIKAKALERNLITREQAAAMSEQEINKLIFAPGFSTAEQITNISGRGVGMDVVRSNIERIGGVVDLFSKFGTGTTIRIKIPLTLAIVPALIVSLESQRFAIPQVSLLELLRVVGEKLDQSIEEIHGSYFFRLRGNLLPLVFLSEELRMRGPGETVQNARRSELNIVVVKADERVFGVVVDAVHDTEEIVVKPLGKQLKEIEVFAGATIMGDGRVALIVDVLGVARRANVLGNSAGQGQREQAQDRSNTEAVSEKQSLLLVRLGEQYRAAIPLTMVNRLEKFADHEIEHASGREVVQYRDGILPLVDLRRSFQLTATEESAEKRVIVYSESGKSVGLVVDQIVDIVEEHLQLQHKEGRNGILGTAIIQKRVTDLLDIPAILRREDGSFYDKLTHDEVGGR